MNVRKLLLPLISLFFLACQKNDNKLAFTVLQINDVYEIGALGGGEIGGLARVETLHKQLKKENPNTLLVHAGDFLNPSLIGTLKDAKGERMKGRQMIDVMNAMHFDLVVPGNHEFDLSYKDLQKRFNESNFQWISTNAQFKTDSTALSPFFKEQNGIKSEIPKTVTFDFKDADGTTIKVGFISAIINSNPKDYVDYGDLYQDAINVHETLKAKVDVVLALTHLTKAQDRLIANSIPDLPIIFGGHEHINMLFPVGNTLISKADANAKTAYVHRITYDKSTKKTSIDSELVNLDGSVSEDKEIARLVQKWNVLLDEKLTEVISDPYEIIYQAASPLDGRDEQIRGEQTNLGQLIATAMSKAFDEEIDCALVNGGSIRIDDELDGAISGIDIFRVLPFGGGIIKVDIKGDLLERTLKYGRLSAGTGAYLQRYNAVYDETSKRWEIGGENINPNKIYKVAFSDYLLLGFDIPFLKTNAKGMVKVYDNKPEDLAFDIRKAVIEYLKTNKF